MALFSLCFEITIKLSRFFIQPVLRYLFQTRPILSQGTVTRLSGACSRSTLHLAQYNLYLLIHLLYFLYSASIHHAGISAIEKQFYYYLFLTLCVCVTEQYDGAGVSEGGDDDPTETCPGVCWQEQGSTHGQVCRRRHPDT